MAMLLFWGQEIDPKMGEGSIGFSTFAPFSSLLDFNLYPLSHTYFPRILWLVTELCIVTWSSRGEEKGVKVYTPIDPAPILGSISCPRNNKIAIPISLIPL